VIFIIKDNLRFGHLSTAYHTNFILMADSNLKNDLKSDIKWTLYGTGPAMIQAFKDNQLDMGYMGLPPAIVGIDKGVPIKCVAGGHVEGTIMIGQMEYKSIDQLNNSIYEVLSQYVGKSIGVTSKGSIHEVILSHYLKKYKLDEEINVKNYGQAEFIAFDMKKGILDGGVGTPALAVFASTILDSHLIIRPEYLWENNPSYGIFFHEKFIENYPDLILTFLTHHKNASFILRDSPSKSAEMITKTFEIINKKYANSVLKISPKYCIALSDGFVKATMEFVDALYNLAYIKRKLEISEIFNFEFIEQVHPEKEHYSSI